jgi:hypothetical protein
MQNPTKPLIFTLLLLMPIHLAYGGSVPEASGPTCVKWCGNDSGSSGNTTSRPATKHSQHTAPIIDVGAIMDAAQVKKNKAKAAELAATKAADAVRQQQEAKNREDLKMRQDEEYKSIQEFKRNLIGGIASDEPNNITLKPIPPRSARSQLDCVANIKPNLKDLDSGAGNWESASSGCTPITPFVPEPPPPTPVKDTNDQLSKMLDALMQQITAKREELVQLDQEIATHEHEVAQESLKVVTDQPESDALSRARAALEKARADRARTADELGKLEQQEQTARKPVPQ